QREGKLDEARKSYSQALQSNPEQDTARNNLAFILADEGSDLQRALGYAQAVRKRYPEDPTPADTLAWTYYKMGNFVLARQQAQFASSKQPDNPAFLYHLGMIYKAANQRKEAETALNKALASPSKAFSERAQAEQALKDMKK